MKVLLRVVTRSRLPSLVSLPGWGGTPPTPNPALEGGGKLPFAKQLRSRRHLCVFLLDGIGYAVGSISDFSTASSLRNDSVRQLLDSMLSAKSDMDGRAGTQVSALQNLSPRNTQLLGKG